MEEILDTLQQLYEYSPSEDVNFGSLFTDEIASAEYKNCSGDSSIPIVSFTSEYMDILWEFEDTWCDAGGDRLTPAKDVADVYMDWHGQLGKHVHVMSRKVTHLEQAAQKIGNQEPPDIDVGFLQWIKVFKDPLLRSLKECLKDWKMLP